LPFQRQIEQQIKIFSLFIQAPTPKPDLDRPVRSEPLNHAGRPVPGHRQLFNGAGNSPRLLAQTALNRLERAILPLRLAAHPGPLSGDLAVTENKIICLPSCQITTRLDGSAGALFSNARCCRSPRSPLVAQDNKRHREASDVVIITSIIVVAKNK
jgi:hypothetical protein